MKRIEAIRKQYDNLDRTDNELMLQECPGFYNKRYPIPKENRGCGLHEHHTAPENYKQIDDLCRACWQQEDE